MDGYLEREHIPTSARIRGRSDRDSATRLVRDPQTLYQALPEAWNGATTSALYIANPLSMKAGKVLPCYTVRQVPAPEHAGQRALPPHTAWTGEQEFAEV